MKEPDVKGYSAGDGEHMGAPQLKQDSGVPAAETPDKVADVVNHDRPWPVEEFYEKHWRPMKQMGTHEELLKFAEAYAAANERKISKALEDVVSALWNDYMIVSRSWPHQYMDKERFIAATAAQSQEIAELLKLIQTDPAVDRAWQDESLRIAIVVTLNALHRAKTAFTAERERSAKLLEAAYNWNRLHFHGLVRHVRRQDFGDAAITEHMHSLYAAEDALSALLASSPAEGSDARCGRAGEGGIGER